ncbi:MAG: hypothetical protein JEY99_21415 [Spirochaetales bacterium]|nr:hypothetical protein [Spirochaetales bacterium]
MAWRNFVSKKLIGEILIINSLYALYLLTIIILNYVKFFQSLENAFWQTTEVWSLGIINIAVFGWRIPFLMFLFLQKKLSIQMKCISGAGFALSVSSIGSERQCKYSIGYSSKLAHR